MEWEEENRKFRKSQMSGKGFKKCKAGKSSLFLMGMI